MLANRLLLRNRRFPTDGLVVRYTMDRFSGLSILDETGNHNGSMVNVVSTTGGYIQLNGTSSYVDITTLTTRPQTFSAAVDITPDSVSGLRVIWAPIGGDGVRQLFISSGLLTLALFNGSTFRQITTPVVAGVRYKIVAINGSSGTQLWVNGVLAASSSGVFSIEYTSEGGRRLGQERNFSVSRYFHGRIWGFAEYDRVLTQPEILGFFS